MIEAKTDDLTEETVQALLSRTRSRPIHYLCRAFLQFRQAGDVTWRPRQARQSRKQGRQVSDLITAQTLTVDMARTLVCSICGHRAICIGRYELPDDAIAELACNECCGHGCEDGHCEFMFDDDAHINPDAVDWIIAAINHHTAAGCRSCGDPDHRTSDAVCTRDNS